MLPPPLRGRVGEGVFANSESGQYPPPCPPPARGEGTLEPRLSPSEQSSNRGSARCVNAIAAAGRGKRRRIAPTSLLPTPKKFLRGRWMPGLTLAIVVARPGMTILSRTISPYVEAAKPRRLRCGRQESARSVFRNARSCAYARSPIAAAVKPRDLAAPRSTSRSVVVRRPSQSRAMKPPSGEHDSIASILVASRCSVSLSTRSTPGECFACFASNAVFQV